MRQPVRLEALESVGAQICHGTTARQLAARGLISGSQRLLGGSLHGSDFCHRLRRLADIFGIALGLELKR